MKVKIVTDTQVNGRYEVAGTIVDTSEASGNRLLMLGWAVAAEEEPPVEAPKAKKPAAKKKAK